MFIIFNIAQFLDSVQFTKWFYNYNFIFRLRDNESTFNLVPRAHVSFGQRQDTELWNNPFQESKIFGHPVSRSMRALALKRRPEVKSMWIRSTKVFNTHSHRLYL